MPALDQKPAKPASGLTNSLANFLGLLVPLAIFFMVTPYVVRGLGVAHFGVLTLFLTAVALLTSFDFGLVAGGVRALGEGLHSKEPGKFRSVARELWSAYLILASAAALILYALRFSFLDMVGLEAELSTGWIGLALPVTIFFVFCSTACTAVPRSMEAFVGVTVIQVLSGVATWMGVAVIVWTHGGLDSVLVWFAVMAGISFLAFAWWANRLGGGLDWRPCRRFPEIRKSLSYNLHAFTGQVASGGTYHADKFLLSHFLGSAAVGHYGLATNIAAKLLTLVVALAGFVFPRSVRMFAADDHEGLRQTYLRSTRYVLLLSWPMLVVAVVLGGPFLRLWVGKEIAAQTEGVFPLLLCSYFIASLSVVASQVFNGIGNARIGAYFALSGAIINVAGCFFMIPRWGLLGAAVASLLSVMQVFGYTRALHRRLSLARFPFARLWLQLLSMAAVQGMVLWVALDWVTNWWSLGLAALCGWAIFYLGWYVLRIADEGDRELLRRVFSAVRRRI